MSAGYASPDYHEDHGYTTSLQRLQVVAGEGEVSSSYSRGSSGGGVVEMATPGVVQVNEFYFPGWRVHVDGLLVATRPSPTGSILIDVGAGRHTIEARFGDTPPRTAGLPVSGVMLLVALGLLAWPQRQRVPSVHTVQSARLRADRHTHVSAPPHVACGVDER
jgi:hypothetical protein